MTATINRRGWAIIVLGVITGVVHLTLGSALFILNGLGYFGLLAVIFAPIAFLSSYRQIGRWVLLGYAILTIILYLVINGDLTDPLGVGTKVVEIGLAILLFMDLRS